MSGETAVPMESFYGRDGVIIRYSRDLRFVIIEDELEVEIFTRDCRAFLDWVRDKELQDQRILEGQYTGEHGTIFWMQDGLSRLFIKDTEGHHLHTSCFESFARLMRERELEALLSKSGLEGVF